MVSSIAASPPLFWSQVALAASLRYWRPSPSSEQMPPRPAVPQPSNYQTSHFFLPAKRQAPSYYPALTPHCPSQCRQPARRLQYSFPEASPQNRVPASDGCYSQPRSYRHLAGGRTRERGGWDTKRLRRNREERVLCATGSYWIVHQMIPVRAEDAW